MPQNCPARLFRYGELVLRLLAVYRALVELRVADCLGGQKENKFSCQTRAITHVQSEPASLAPEVNPLLFHAFLPANVILHFPAGSRDVVGHLSAQCSVPITT